MAKPEHATIYTLEGCPYCARAKALLTSYQIPYDEIDVGPDEAKRQKLAAKTGASTVPQIFLDDEFIGGVTELQKMADDGALGAAAH